MKIPYEEQETYQVQVPKTTTRAVMQKYYVKVPYQQQQTYTVTVTREALPPAPEIKVTGPTSFGGSNVDITSGTTIDFDTIFWSDPTPHEMTFTIENAGDSDLTITGTTDFVDITGDINFWLSEPALPPTQLVLIPGETQAFTIQFMEGDPYATKSGTTIAMKDIEVPKSKVKMLAEAEEKTTLIDSQYENGLITDDERYDEVVRVWMETTDKVTDATQKSLDPFSGIYMMATSGAKGNITQIRQMAGMRGLMTNPSGRIIDFPINQVLAKD